MMRSHFLNDLSIHGKEAILEVLPDFDFYNLRRVTSFNWTGKLDVISGRTTVDFAITAVYDDPQRGSVSSMRLRCSDVKQLRLPELGTSFFFAEIELEDISSSQIEGARYRLKDFGESQFEVLCGEIDLTTSESG